MKHRLALLQDAKAFAKAKLADGWNVSAGTSIHTGRTDDSLGADA